MKFKIFSTFVIALIGLAAFTSFPAVAGAAAVSGFITSPDTLPWLGFSGLIVNAANLSTLFTGFKANFQRGLDQADPQYKRVCTVVPSTTSEEKYGWLGKLPSVREWIGDRVVQNLLAHDYSIKNKDFELTVGVDRNSIKDDQYGVYAPFVVAMGESMEAHPDELVWPLLKAGFTTNCYDGQYYFDTDHPVLDAGGNQISVANTDGGVGTPWFLIDDSRPLKPVIFQERQKPNFVSLDKDNDENVFNRREYVYGSHSRHNVGYGFWQYAWGSKQTLNKANYKIARAALIDMKGDYDRPLNNKPRLLVVPGSLESEALEITNAERDAAGATNVYKGTAEVLVVPWLA